MSLEKVEAQEEEQLQTVRIDVGAQCGDDPLKADDVTIVEDEMAAVVAGDRNDVLSALADAFGGLLQKESAGEQVSEAFVAKVVSFIAAEMSSELFFLLIRIPFVILHAPEQTTELLPRAIYAVLVTLTCTTSNWLMRDMKPSRGFFSDTLKLFKTSTGVLIAWGWKDLCATIVDALPHRLWLELVLAVLVTIVVSGSQLSTCYAAAKANVAAGGVRDTLRARFVLLPASMGLTLGYSWNLVATYFITVWQDQVANLHAQFFMQAGYSAFIGVTVQKITLMISRRLRADADSMAKRHVTSLTVLTTSISFVQAWAVLDAMDNFFFAVCYGCSSPTTCSYQSNLIFATFVSLFFSKIAYQMKITRDEDEDEETSEALLINSMMLTTGWAWKNFFVTWEEAISGDLDGFENFLSHLVLLIFVWTLCSAIFHFVSDIRRGKDRMRGEIVASISHEAARDRCDPRVATKTAAGEKSLQTE